MLENPRLCNACEIQGVETKAKRRTDLTYQIKGPARMSNGVIEDDREDSVTVSVATNEYLHYRSREGADYEVDLCTEHWREALEGILEKL